MKLNNKELEYLLTIVCQCQVFIPKLYNSELENKIGNAMLENKELDDDTIKKIANILVAMQLVGNPCMDRKTNDKIFKKMEEI